VWWCSVFLGVCCADCLASQHSLTLTLPAGRVSNIMFMAANGAASSTVTVFLAFYNNCLQLPNGLVYVDDHMTATGGWES
jgi:hypothetical protein